MEGVAPKHFWGRSFSSAVVFSKKQSDADVYVYIP